MEQQHPIFHPVPPRVQVMSVRAQLETWVFIPCSFPAAAPPTYHNLSGLKQRLQHRFCRSRVQVGLAGFSALGFPSSESRC